MELHTCSERFRKTDGSKKYIARLCTEWSLFPFYIIFSAIGARVHFDLPIHFRYQISLLMIQYNPLEKVQIKHTYVPVPVVF